MKKTILIGLALLTIFVCGVLTKEIAATALWYPKEIEISITNLPKDKTNTIEVLLLLKPDVSPTPQNSDGTVSVYRNVDDLDKTTCYYKTILNTTEAKNSTVKLNISSIEKYMGTEYSDTILIKINDNISSLQRLSVASGKMVEKSYYSLDYENMQLKNINNTHKISDIVLDYLMVFFSYNIILNVIMFIISIAFTLILKIIICKIFDIHSLKVVTLVNLILQTVFYLGIIGMVTLLSSNGLLLAIALFELIVIISEYLLYRKYIENVASGKIIAFSLAANICSLIIVPVLVHMINSII